jgi:hypothetical protein
MDRRHRRGKRRLKLSGRSTTAFSNADAFYSEYRHLTVIPPASSKPRRPPPLLAAGALIALGAALVFAFTR